MITEISFEGIDKIGDYDIKDLGKINLIIPHSYDCGTWFEYLIRGILDGLDKHKNIAPDLSLRTSMIFSFGSITVKDVDRINLPQSSIKVIADDSSFVEVDLFSNCIEQTSSSLEDGEFFAPRNENLGKQAIFNMHETFNYHDDTKDDEKIDRENGILLFNLMCNPYSLLEEHDCIENLLEHKNDYGQIFIISYSYVVLDTLKDYAYKHHNEIKLVSLYKDNRLVSDWLENEPENLIED